MRYRYSRHLQHDWQCSSDKWQIPSIKPDEILVKVRAASLCHSDLMLFEPNEQGLVFGDDGPFTMVRHSPVVSLASLNFSQGHEGCGTVLQCGAEVKGFREGEKLGWLPIVDVCFDCEECQIHNLYCEQGTAKVQGFKLDGYFQQ